MRISGIKWRSSLVIVWFCLHGCIGLLNPQQPIALADKLNLVEEEIEQMKQENERILQELETTETTRETSFIDRY